MGGGYLNFNFIFYFSFKKTLLEVQEHNPRSYSNYYWKGHSDNMASSDENLPTSSEEDNVNEEDLKIMDIRKIDQTQIKSVGGDAVMIGGDIFKSSGRHITVPINGIVKSILNQHNGLLYKKGMKISRSQELLFYAAHECIKNKGVMNSVKGYNDEELIIMVNSLRQHIDELVINMRKGKLSEYDVYAVNPLVHLKVVEALGYIEESVYILLPDWLLRKLDKFNIIKNVVEC